ncbi:hypothetical protein CEXT_407831 [Caerostris extrusa]|uniref:Uncharacterized protein n=1 Tax=Caerostris extrusa TaxID=172846 RepID=A0AAV4QI31_CAEEX|nr:hypothetical protein CEXT_407831 [Caerostris extrusa]
MNNESSAAWKSGYATIYCLCPTFKNGPVNWIWRHALKQVRGLNFEIIPVSCVHRILSKEHSPPHSLPRTKEMGQRTSLEALIICSVFGVDCTANEAVVCQSQKKGIKQRILTEICLQGVAASAVHRFWFFQ